MKIELEVNSDQLKLLDSGLKELLLNLTEEQKIELLQNYIDKQLENFRVLKQHSYWGSTSEYEYTDFGKQVIDGLRDKIADCITDDVLNKPEIKEYMGSIVNDMKQDLPEIIQKSIIQYIINNLFTDKVGIEHICTQIYNDIMTRRSNNL